MISHKVKLILILASWILFYVDCQDYFSDYIVTAVDGSDISLNIYKEKPAVLVVNIALNCAYAFTKFKELNEFYTRNKDLGIEVLGFPSGQFGHESNHPEDLIISTYNITFPIFKQIDVNGPNAIPLYKYLKRKTSPEQISWNFNKFLIVNNIPVERFSPQISISEIEKKIFQYIKTSNEIDL
jgi:glutathione peroxidase